MSTDIKPNNPKDIQHLVLFDGVCGLCNSFVDFLMRKDKKNKLKFAPLQGETAGTFDVNIDIANLKTVIFYSKGRLFTKSNAVIEILKVIGGFWKIAVIGKIVPGILRNYLYNFVARNRLKWFGQKETCRMPTEKERGKLLP